MKRARRGVGILRTRFVVASLAAAASVAGLSGAPAYAASPTDGVQWNLVWSDEFDGPDGSLPDPTKWGHDTGGHGWGNNELQNYTNRAENTRQEGGHLVLEARQEAFGTNAYTSGRLKTQGVIDWTYGKFEARLKIPTGRGIWPAFWMLGTNISTVGWPQSGEIDIMEHVNNDLRFLGSLHGPGYSGGSPLSGIYNVSDASYFDSFHNYSIEWGPDVVYWFIDDNLYSVKSRHDAPVGAAWAFNDHPFFIIMNVAVGGNWPGSPDASTVFPKQMLVDHVRVYAADRPLPVPTPAPTPTPGPFRGAPAPIPGTIQAEDFDYGGEGIAYHDNDAANNGGAYRPRESVDIGASGDADGGPSVGWAGAGEWLNYAVNVAEDGVYTFDVRVASNGVGGIFHVEMDGLNVTGPIGTPNTGGWATWQTLTVGVSLTAGPHTMRLVLETNGPSTATANFNWFRFTPGEPPPQPPPPIVFEAEDLALTAVGANGNIATETTPSANTLPSNSRYVSLGADGNPMPPGGEYVEFTLPNIPAGTYTLVLRYKSHQANRGIMQLSVDGQPLGSPLNQHLSPAAFRAATIGVVRFGEAGDHTVRLAVIGRDATAAAYTITADVFTLLPDGTAPVLSLPSDQTLEATGPGGAVATYTGSASDDLDGPVPVTFTPPSGTLFPLGTTVVQATARDFAGNEGTGRFRITIEDTTPPVLTLPADLVVEATSPDGAVVTFTGSAQDAVSGSLPVAFVPASGAVFPLGVTVVTATATDGAGRTSVGQFQVTVRDTTPPVLTLPASRTIETNNAAGMVVAFSAGAQDVVSGAVPVTLTPASGSLFPLGTTTVVATATDAAGNRANGSFTITVRVAAWKTGVSYQIGHLAVYQGTTWKCIRAHRAQTDWTPPRTPALWVKVPTGNQWDHPVEYAVGAQVVYSGVTYTCLQAHISQAGWTPPATPALWRRP